MERLTMNNGLCQMASTEFCLSKKDCYSCPHGRKCFKRLAAYEDTDLEPEEIDSEFINQVIEENRRLKELAQAEKDGRLIVPPCKVGDIMYEANKRGFISIYKVISIHISDCSMLIGWELVDGIYSNLNGFEVSALGETVFLTREEAEAALKKREEEDNDS